MAWKSPFKMSRSPVPSMWAVFEVSENIHTLSYPPPPPVDGRSFAGGNNSEGRGVLKVIVFKGKYEVEL